MKCMNPECESLNADELNITLNVSDTEPDIEETEYTGSTDYAAGSNLHLAIGTTCVACEKDVFESEWMFKVSKAFGHPDLVV